MSSTERDELSNQLQRFFEERLMPVAEALRARRAELFATGPDADRSSYYVERARRRMTPDQFEIAGLDTPESIGRTLGQFWKQRQMPELARLAPELGRLAGALREVEEETDEVSPFIYVMF